MKLLNTNTTNSLCRLDQRPSNLSSLILLHYAKSFINPYSFQTGGRPFPTFKIQAGFDSNLLALISRLYIMHSLPDWLSA